MTVDLDSSIIADSSLNSDFGISFLLDSNMTAGSTMGSAAWLSVGVGSAILSDSGFNSVARMVYSVLSGPMADSGLSGSFIEIESLTSGIRGMASVSCPEFNVIHVFPRRVPLPSLPPTLRPIQSTPFAPHMSVSPNPPRRPKGS